MAEDDKYPRRASDIFGWKKLCIPDPGIELTYNWVGNEDRYKNKGRRSVKQGSEVLRFWARK